METKTPTALGGHISAPAAWAFAIGTSIGWGSLVVTNHAYLGQAGPLGSVIGMVVGMVIMLVISRNYAYMMHAYPEAGGAYAYSREIFGYDHGFLTAWFLLLTYFAMLWANATSLPLFARYFFGDIFRFGKIYTLFGYDVYAGEALLSITAIALFAVLCSRFPKFVARLMLAMALLFAIGITVCFLCAIFRTDRSLSPAFLPDQAAFSQVVKIACISPWAFIGFESISHGVEEFSFQKARIFRVLVLAVVSTTLLYIFVMLLSVTAYPPEYASWLDYIRDLDNLEGLKGLPAFYAAYHYLGNTGVLVLMGALLCLIFTSLIGNITALSRLFFALGKDDILPQRFGKLNQKSIPGMAILLIACISFLIPFLGRTAIGWIVDVTTLGATLIYGYVSASALRLARKCGDKIERVTGVIGLVISILFGLYMLLPNLFTTGSMETESYFLFVVWGVLGFLYFRYVLGKDKDRRFGRSIVVWIALLSLVLFVSLVWMSRSIMEATDRGMQYVQNYYMTAGPSGTEGDIVAAQMQLVRQISTRSILIVVALFALSLIVLLNIYRLMNKRALMSEEQLGQIREMANKDPLTGVKSKHAYSEKEQEIDAQIRQGDMEAFALVVCDVNGLKYMNDTYGHKAGDEYLRKAAHLICTCFDHSPVYRTGGDEFVAVLTGEDYQNRAQILQQLFLASSGNIGTEEAVVAAGMAEFIPGQTDSLHAVFEQADARMYENKKELKSMGARTR